MVLGLPDPGVWMAYLLCILSMLLCVVWGVFRWNAAEEEEPPEKIKHWAEEEDKVEEEL